MYNGYIRGDRGGMWVVGNKLIFSANYGYGISATGNYGEISNNVVFSTPGALGQHYARSTGRGKVAGNIVYNASLALGISVASQIQITRNLCLKLTADTCGSAAEGNLTNTDP